MLSQLFLPKANPPLSQGGGTRPSRTQTNTSSRSEDITTRPLMPFLRSSSERRITTSSTLYRWICKRSTPNVFNEAQKASVHRQSSSHVATPSRLSPHHCMWNNCRVCTGNAMPETSIGFRNAYCCQDCEQCKTACMIVFWCRLHLHMYAILAMLIRLCLGPSWMPQSLGD